MQQDKKTWLSPFIDKDTFIFPDFIEDSVYTLCFYQYNLHLRPNNYKYMFMFCFSLDFIVFAKYNLYICTKFKKWKSLIAPFTSITSFPVWIEER